MYIKTILLTMVFMCILKFLRLKHTGYDPIEENPAYNTTAKKYKKKPDGTTMGQECI
ncbi:hypothetical protein [Chryseobacterium gwangjuense]|uniref:hypothetical protein n=1 Tax=Chryseobacterium gwangjuense TaxID=1069980 RepID=UPI001E2D5E2E|nr:hypothetical protein [Chryseobacterium gwangjuense]MCE3074665.1 hypothetical protein [Chryseobacterium gwangjuense]